MQTTPNLGLVIPDSDADPFDWSGFSTPFQTVDSKVGLVALWDSLAAGVTFPAASITTPPLPSGFRHLIVVGAATADVSSSPFILLRFNGDTGFHYNGHSVYSSASAWTYGDSPGANAIVCGLAARSGGGGIGGFITEISDYTSTSGRGIAIGSRFAAVGDPAAGNIFTGLAGGSWSAGAAISTITFLLQSGNFSAASRLTIYGAV